MSGFPAALLAAIGPLALNMPGVAFTGMEHTLHTAICMVVLLGLWRFLQHGELTVWFLLAAVLSPLIRMEGLALSLMAAAAVFWRGQVRTGIWLGFAIVVPLLAFAGFLVSLGLDPLPSSVLTKMSDSGADRSWTDRLLGTVLGNTSFFAGKILAALTLISIGLILMAQVLRNTAARSLLVVLAASGFAHLFFGKFGWMSRYENYILVTMTAGLILAGAQLVALKPQTLVPARLVLFAALLGSTVVYWPPLLFVYSQNPRAIYLQQAQMGRFAKEFMRAPVAVNDLGQVAWRNENYVLDLWGLGSQDARRIRQAGIAPSAGWADALVKAKDVQVAMIYEKWLAGAIGPNWVKLGELSMVNPMGWLGGYTVSFFATDPTAVRDVGAKLRAFGATLPADAVMTLTEDAK
jgi:hypothetical protein